MLWGFRRGDLEWFCRVREGLGRVQFDSRLCGEGDIFFALPGTRTHGSRFIGEVLDRGVGLVVTDDGVWRGHDRVVVVRDALRFFQAVAWWWRRTRLAGVLVIGVGGSVGKTSTSSLLQEILGGWLPAWGSPRSFNNHTGVPWTILNTHPKHCVCVQELGGNRTGDLIPLLAVAQPQWGVLVSLSPTHLEGYGTWWGMVREECRLVGWIRERGSLVVVPGMDALLDWLTRGVPRCIVGSGGLRARVVSALPLAIEFQGVLKDLDLVQMRVGGDFLLRNVLLAVGVAYRLGVPVGVIRRGLERWVPPGPRLRYLEVGGWRLWLDAYNASPESMRASLLFFVRHFPPPYLLVLGDMQELGGYADEAHRSLLRLVEEWFSREEVLLVLVGELFSWVPKGLSSRVLCRVGRIEDLPEGLWRDLQVKYPELSVFIKGSRVHQLERLVLWIEGVWGVG